MRNITLKVLERNSAIKAQWPRELDNHRKFCVNPSFVIDENEVSCDGCYRVLLKFCQFCGSTSVEESKFYYKCTVCKAITEKKFL